MNQPVNKFHIKANQVFAYALHTFGDLRSMSKTDPMSLKVAFYGLEYVQTSTNNAAYNRSRGNAEKDGIIMKAEGAEGLYTLAEQGHKLIAWAEENKIDLSKVKTDARLGWEAKHKA